MARTGLIAGLVVLGAATAALVGAAAGGPTTAVDTAAPVRRVAAPAEEILMEDEPTTPGASADGMRSSTPQPDAANTPASTPTPDRLAEFHDRTSLPLIDSWAITPDAPPDDGSGEVGGLAHVAPHGAVVHVAPAGEVVGLLPGITLMDDTASPILGRRGDWLRVMLPSRRAVPSSGAAVNGATGWIHGDDVSAVVPATHRVVVDLDAHTVAVHAPTGVVTVPTRHGAPATPTPVGRTFVASRWSEDSSTPLVAALGAHSPTLESFDGGPAVVAIHVYDGDTRPGAGSNGCVRLDAEDWGRAGLASLPIGTPGAGRRRRHLTAPGLRRRWRRMPWRVGHPGDARN